MKKRYFSLSPFAQVMMLFVIGLIAFFVLSIITSLIISGIYPKLATESIQYQILNYPISFMLVNFLPVQLGLLLTPGIIYIYITKNKYNTIKRKSFVLFLWGILLFTGFFFLMPFISQINFEALKFLNLYEILAEQKEIADEQLNFLIGEVGSSSFFVAVLIVGIITGISEELIFRRFLLHHLYSNTKKISSSLLISSLVFALMHFNYLQILPIFIFGMVLGLMYFVSGSIIPSIIAHATNNIINLYWLAGNNFPKWTEKIDLKFTIPATILVFVLLIFLKKHNKSS